MQTAGGFGLFDGADWGASTDSQSGAGNSDVRAGFEDGSGIGGGAGDTDF